MDYKAAAEFWLEKDKNAVKMPQDELTKELDTFLKEQRVCTLAAADGDFIRCTPLTYAYLDGKFYIFSEGGLKFRALAENKNVALEIHAEYHGVGSAKSVQVTGVAEVIGAERCRLRRSRRCCGHERRKPTKDGADPHRRHGKKARISELRAARTRILPASMPQSGIRLSANGISSTKQRRLST